MVKIITLFLIFILVLAMFGRLRLPKVPGLKSKKKVQAAVKCPKCGRYNIAGKDCDCK